MRWRPVLGLLLVASLIAACGDDDFHDPGPIGTSTVMDTPTTAQTTDPPVYGAQVLTVTAEDLYASWREGCPHPVEELRAVVLTHWGYDGAVHEGRLIVDAALAEEVVDIFRDLFDARFPIERIEPIDVYGGDDNRSISANNTSAFNCRPSTGGTSWSEHAYGRAIDVNPLVNPYVDDGAVLPPEAAVYTDRTRTDPGLLHDGDAAVRAFERRGWIWGGTWQSLKDYQHFSPSGR